MKNLFLVVCFLASGFAIGQDSIRFKIVMGGELLDNIDVAIKGAHNGTDKGFVTLKRPRNWCSKSKPREIIISYKGTYPFYKVFTRSLTQPYTVIECENKPIRRFHDSLRNAVKRDTELLAERKKLWDSIKILEPRVVTYVESHPAGTMEYYQKHLVQLKTELTALGEEQLRHQNRLKHIVQELVFNRFAEGELVSVSQDQRKMKKEQEVYKGDVAEININLENDPDRNLTDNELKFGRSSAEIIDKTVLEQFAKARIPKLRDLKKHFQGRETIILIQVVGFADIKPYSPQDTCNTHCPKPFIDLLDCNKCLSWKRANNVYGYLHPLFDSLGTLQSVVIGKGNELAQNEAYKLPEVTIGDVVSVKNNAGDSKKILYDDTTQQQWRRCTISVIFISKKIYQNTYAAVNN